MLIIMGMKNREGQGKAGRHVRELRVDLGMSQEGLARLLGVSLQTVHRWESGLNRPLPFLELRIEELRRKAAEKRSSTGGNDMKKTTPRAHADGRVEPGLGGLFKGVGSLLDLVARMSEEGKSEFNTSGETEAMGGKAKVIHGFSVRLGLGGKPVIERFGNIKETESGPEVIEAREPLVDVLDEGDTVLVVCEMPGVDESDIRLHVEDDTLDLSASGNLRRYHKEVLLPTGVDPASLKSSYRNGILEVRLAKRPPTDS